MKKNALNWFEIYVDDMDRAKNFYETILGIEMEKADDPKWNMSLFPHDYENGVGGAIMKMEGYGPGPGGTLVYLNASGQMIDILKRIPEAGGKVIEDRMEIPPHGYIAIFQDIEGNVVGLHSMD